MTEEFETKAPNFYKWAQAVAVHPSVTSIYEEDVIVKYFKARLEKSKAS